jgi:hypothetical protein
MLSPLTFLGLLTPALPALGGRDEDFYEPPADLAGYAPGDLVRAEPMQAFLLPGVRLRARGWRVLYRSTGACGEPTAVSGTVLLPATPRAEPTPLVGFAIGTHGMGDAAAPSRLLARGLDYEAASIAMVLAHGWAVAITDYQGLGTPGDHTYLVGRALGPNVLDCMRAARGLHPHELPADGPAAVVGYSEGGAAAGWAAQLQPTYAPDVALRAVVAGAAPADPELGGRELEGTFFSFFAAYGAIGYAAAYPELQLEPLLTPDGRARLSSVRNSTIVGAALRGPHFARGSDLTTPSILDLPDWQARFGENRLGAIAPPAPVLLHHAPPDAVVRFRQSITLRDEWRALGADARLYATPGPLDHASAGLVGTRVGLNWLAERLDARRVAAASAAAPRLADAA